MIVAILPKEKPAKGAGAEGGDRRRGRNDCSLGGGLRPPCKRFVATLYCAKSYGT